MYYFKNIGSSGPRVLLLHGLYATAGTWIPVLKYFKECKVTLITIDYHKAILEGEFSELVSEVSSKLSFDFHTVIVHSFGSLCLNFLDLKSKNNLYISPPFLASKFSCERYLHSISSSTNYGFDEISLVVKRAIQMSMNINMKPVATDIFLLPASDEYFVYENKIFSVHYFPGTHSTVDLAVACAFSKNLISY